MYTLRTYIERNVLAIELKAKIVVHVYNKWYRNAGMIYHMLSLVMNKLTGSSKNIPHKYTNCYLFTKLSLSIV